MHKRSLRDDLQRSKKSLKITRLYEDEVIKLKTLKTRRIVRDSFISSSNNEDENDEDEDMALVVRKFKKFYKKGFNKRGKKPPFKKGGQSSLLFKAKLEATKKKKKGKGLIGAWDQDSSESGGGKPTCASWH
ncbi:hypothetical protein M9H77_30659 [Catharanthus roseus]|uniref:Uncharacterized protein n=1 Tax=Catharanthus roseus TaxID=4058 RepID=A0ACB9ZXX3_CATRO|nr:hypothetical protein M9H77_30659 [Catharanthus roseus]